MRYNTGNPVEPNGSSDPRDLYDNSANTDLLINGAMPAYSDRTGQQRKSFSGMELDFNQFLINSGFEPNRLVYANRSQLIVDRPTQLIDRDGSIYRAKVPASFPLTLTGTWTADSENLVDVGDTSLRQDLATSAAGKGVDIVANATRIVDSIAAARLLSIDGAKWITVSSYYGGSNDILSFYRVDQLDITTPDDGVTCLEMIDGGRLKLNHNGSIDIRQAGAIGSWNGTTGADDTEAIQRAVDSGIREIRIPPVGAGFSYQTTTPINITKSVYLVGGGVETQIQIGVLQNQRGGDLGFILTTLESDLI